PPGEVANLQDRVCLLEGVERNRYGAVQRLRLAQTPKEDSFQHGESFLWRGGRAQAFAEFGCRPSPEPSEIGVCVGEIVHRNAENGGRAARSEVNADERRMYERVDQEEVAVRPRDNRPRIPLNAAEVRWIENPNLVVAEVNDQIDRTARQNLLP